MAQIVRRSSAPATAAVARIKGSTSTMAVEDATEKLTPNRRHAAYKRFTSGLVVMVLIEETFEAGSAWLIDASEPWQFIANELQFPWCGTQCDNIGQVTRSPSKELHHNDVLPV